jgi:CHAD domain-containing protein
MKDALQLRFSSIATAAQAEQHLLAVRFAECMQRQAALDGDDDERLHAFRLACKRLRFAIERLDPAPPSLAQTASFVSTLTDELGFAHDCARLAKLAEDCGAMLVAARARRDRARYVARARRMWRSAFRTRGEFAPLAAYAGFTWGSA